MMLRLLLIVLLLPSVAFASIYRYTDKQGNVYYSDTKKKGAKKIRLKPMQSYQPAPVVTSVDHGMPASKAKKNYYDSIDIMVPKQNQTLWSSSGDIMVEIALLPGISNGDRLAYWLDGKLYKTTKSSAVKLQNVQRGRHSVSVNIMNVFGDVVLTSKTHSFHVQRPSRLSVSRAR